MRLLAIIVFLIVNSICLSGANPSDSDDLLIYYFEKAREAINNKEAAYSLYYSHMALRESPYHPAVLVMAGNACYKHELYASAIYYYQEAIKESENAKAYTNLANTYATLGYDDLALQAVDKGNEGANKYTILGGINIRHGKYDEGIAYTKKAFVFGADKIPYYNIGVAFAEADKMDSALYYINKALEIDPKFITAYIAKAGILKDMEHKEEYEEICKKVISLFPEGTKNPYNLFSKGSVYKILGDKEKMEINLRKGIEKMNEYIELYPEAYTFISERGIAYESLGEKDAAIADYKRTLEIEPRYEKIKKKLAKILSE